MAVYASSLVFFTAGCAAAAPILASSTATTSPAAASDLTSEDVSIRGDGGITLNGTILELVAAAPGRPGLVLVHGSGSGTPRTRLLDEAAAFARQGISVLIYDKRSAGYTAFERSYSQLANDAVGAVDVLATHPGVDPTRLGIWGISEGGWVAPLAATRSTDIAFVIVVGANAMPPLQQQTWAVGSALRRAGVSGSLVDRAEPEMFRLLADAGAFAEARYDAAAVLQNMRQPLLGIWGTEDLQTSPEENPPLFAQALLRGGNTHFTMRFLTGADHDLHESADGGVTSLPSLAPGYAQLVGSWIDDVTGGQLPNADVGVPPHRAWPTVRVPPSSWWESARVQLLAFWLLIASFVAPPLLSLIRRMRSQLSRVNNSARVLAVVGPAAVFGFFAYMIYLLATAGVEVAPGPIVAARPLPWLLLQLLTLLTIGATAATLWPLRRSDFGAAQRLRLVPQLAGAGLFLLWAVYWGLLP